ncbi:ABC transporter substrate-binding protein [uncultured Sphaerochaeta sp.]|uniref:ABC transporter substrate-binding protein n=1 Tax=uncultured Sphaerochaeta sp. TaxID=886478 RepID=UPI002A0A74C7|nr:ABC transporter substrate-binding protein [uncultured Sphaerochaeta sp.]
MKRALVIAIMVSLLVVPLFAQGSKEGPSPSDTSKQVYPDGTLLIWSTGQPQFRKMYYQDWIERNRDIAPGVNIAVETISTMSEGQQKLAMYALSGDTGSMPEVIMLDAVGIVNLVSAGLLQDMTSFYTPLANEFVDGAVSDATIGGKVYGLPDAVRPQLLFYNAEIFKKYNVDPSMMSTFEGYYEAGKLLKERSNGEVYLSYIDPGTYTWRYWGRRGLMPQANARIWDEKGNIVIGQDPGAKRALEYLAKLNEAGLLYKTRMMQQPLYEATDDGKIATYYIGAFWDEFLRKNITTTAGDWKVMNVPVFKEIGTGGAPVSTSFCLVDTGSNEYTKLFQMLWYDFQTNTEERNSWVAEMEKLKGPYSNPVAKNVLADSFWQAPSEFYGGQSFRKAEGDGLANSSKNMTVTASDAEADTIISAELEKYIAGEQTMDQAIANMDKELKIRIKKVLIP